MENDDYYSIENIRKRYEALTKYQQDFYQRKKDFINECIENELKNWTREQCVSEIKYLENELHKIQDAGKIHDKSLCLHCIPMHPESDLWEDKDIKYVIARIRFQFSEWNK